MRILRDLATHKLDLPPAQLAKALSEGLSDRDTREASLLAIAGRAAGVRLKPSEDRRARWRMERETLVALRSGVVSALDDPAPRTRAAAVLALASLSYDIDAPANDLLLGEDVVQVLGGVYRSEVVAFNRGEIVKTLALCADRSSARLGLLLEAAEDQSDNVVAYALMGLGRIRSAEALGLIAGKLASSSRNVRLAAAQAIAAYGSEALPFIPALQQQLEKETEPIVRKTLEGSLRALQSLERDPIPPEPLAG